MTEPRARDVLSHDPFNAETPLDALRAPITATDRFYVRSNFSAPALDEHNWTLRIHGAVGTERTLDLADLKALGAERRVVTLECAGNGRTFLEPAVSGTPWTLGATSTAEFVGVPLQRVLESVGLADDAVELVFTGADRGERAGWGEIAFQRSLPVAELASFAAEGPLLAWQMNGEPLPGAHGGPVRLVVPGWYAVASVKWLIGLEAVRTPFEGHFQTDRYLYHEADGTTTPVTHMKVRALILDPDPEVTGADGRVQIAAGTRRIEGIAWSGSGAITGVAVSMDGGATWGEATLEPAAPEGAPRRWSFDWAAIPGTTELVARARDASGAEQPLDPWWNSLGYGNNSVHRVQVEVR